MAVAVSACGEAVLCTPYAKNKPTRTLQGQVELGAEGHGVVVVPALLPAAAMEVDVRLRHELYWWDGGDDGAVSVPPSHMTFNQTPPTVRSTARPPSCARPAPSSGS